MKSCRGWIYCITNKINGKKYIGQTIDYDTRVKQHFYNKTTKCRALYAAMCKYGKDNFKIEIIVTFEAVNKQVCKKVLNVLEVFYINKYNSLTTQDGYNISRGGSGNMGVKHTKEAKLKISLKKKGKRMPEGFGDIVRARHPENNLPDNRKPVLLYNLKGIFVKEYNSITEALKSMGKSVKMNTYITKCLNKNNHQCYGYMWRYKNESQFPNAIDSYQHLQAKLLYHYTKDGILIDSYSSISEASINTGLSNNLIEHSLSRSKIANKHFKDYWSYTPPTA